MSLLTQLNSAAAHPAPRRVPAPDPQPLEAWFTRCPVPTSFGLALQWGLLEREFGTDAQVRLRALQESRDPRVLQSHYLHTQPNSFRHGGNIPAIYAKANGADTRVIGLSFQHGGQQILTRPDSGIRTVADLRGRRVAVPRRPHEAIDHAWLSSLRTYQTALAQAGLTLDDVEVVEQTIHTAYIDDRLQQRTSLREAEPALQTRSTSQWSSSLYPLIRGEVDAIVAGGTQAANFATQGGLAVVFDSSTLPVAEQANNNTPLVFAVSAELAEKRPDLVIRVLRQALEAERLATHDPDHTLTTLARELAQPERLLRHSSGEHLIDNLRLDFAPWKIAALKSQVQFLRERRAIPQHVDVDDWLQPELLAAARGGEA